MSKTKRCPCGSGHEGESGGYYTSVVDGPDYGLLLGPFETHGEALEWVDRVRAAAEKANARAVFYAFGSCRAKDSYREPGRLNGWDGLPAPGGKIGIAAAKRAAGK